MYPNLATHFYINKIRLNTHNLINRTALSIAILTLLYGGNSEPRGNTSYICVCICYDGVVITAQCTATFSDLLCSPEFRYY